MLDLPRVQRRSAEKLGELSRLHYCHIVEDLLHVALQMLVDGQRKMKSPQLGRNCRHPQHSMAILTNEEKIRVGFSNPKFVISRVKSPHKRKICYVLFHLLCSVSDHSRQRGACLCQFLQLMIAFSHFGIDRRSAMHGSFLLQRLLVLEAESIFITMFSLNSVPPFKALLDRRGVATRKRY